MYISKIYLGDNFVPDVFTDQYRRRQIHAEVTLREGDSLSEAEAIGETYIKDYIYRNTVSRCESVVTLPGVPPEIPNVQLQPEPIEKEPTLEESIRDAQTVEELQAWRHPANANPETAFIFKARMKQLEAKGKGQIINAVNQ